jgi:hypothetical protein
MVAGMVAFGPVRVVTGAASVEVVVLAGMDGGSVEG